MLLPMLSYSYINSSLTINHVGICLYTISQFPYNERDKIRHCTFQFYAIGR